MRFPSSRAPRPRSPRWVFWALAFALVLQAGMPALSAAAAKLRGVAVAEVCEVYGVALPSAAAAVEPAGAAHRHHHPPQGASARLASLADDPDAGHPAGHGSHAPGAHGGGHCALTALGALASVQVPTALCEPARRHAVPSTSRTGGPVFRDAAAAWAARRKHGPPAET